MRRPLTSQTQLHSFLGQKPREQAIGGSEDGKRTSVVAAGAVAETERERIVRRRARLRQSRRLTRGSRTGVSKRPTSTQYTLGLGEYKS